MADAARTMKAAVATPSGCEIREVPVPTPGADQVLVRVRVAGLNRADLSAARAAGPNVSIPGLDWSGEVVAVGGNVRHVKPGDRVMCSGSGGYAEYAVTDLGRVTPLGNSFSYEQGATLHVALLTMHNAVMTAGRMRPGETVLIQGASAGVGLMGLQIAKLKGASLVIGTSTTPERRARLKEFGADLAIDSNAADWVEQVKAATGGKGVNLIVDQVSGRLANEQLEATAILGRIVNVGRLGGAKGEFDFNTHAARRIDYIGVTFRTRSVEEVREIARLMDADIGDAVRAGKLTLPIDKVFPLDEARSAQAYMAANRHFGKILLKVA